MCLLVYALIENKIILAKNRDRYYIANLEIVHEIINGTEVVYVKDEKSECIDGMNEYGIGYINSQLNIGNYIPENIFNEKMDYIRREGPIIKKRILSEDNFKEAINILLNNKYFDDLSVQGHILIGTPEKCIHIESTFNNEPFIEEISRNTILTNHGIKYTNVRKNKNYKSSIIRKKIMEEKLKSIYKVDDLLLKMREKCNIEPYLCPYKDRLLIKEKKEGKIENTNYQVLYNLTDKVVYFNYDLNSSIFKGIKNKLPKNYKPKIKIIVGKIGSISKIDFDENITLIFFLSILIVLFCYIISKK